MKAELVNQVSQVYRYSRLVLLKMWRGVTRSSPGKFPLELKLGLMSLTFLNFEWTDISESQFLDVPP